MSNQILAGNKPQYLTIQKLVKLLTPFHRFEFEQYLRETKANFPLKLIESISPDLFEVESSDNLCTAVYGKCDNQTKKSFNQLASHTFRLTVYLSRNYPSYLWHNVQLIERFLADGELIKGNLLAELLLDMAEKTEDFLLQAQVLNFFSQQANLLKSQGEAIRYMKQKVDAIEKERAVNDIYYYLRINFNISLKDDSALKKLDEHLAYLRSLESKESAKINMLAKFARFFVLYYYRPAEYLTKQCQDELNEFIEDQNKNSMVVLPYLEDIFSKITLYRLNFSNTDLNSKDGRTEFQRLLSHSKFLKFWQNYVNKPELYAIAIKSTYYLSRYHSINHRKDFESIIPVDDRQDIVKLIARCEELLSQDIWEPDHVKDLIHLRLTYAALLMLGEEEQIRKGIDNLEELMISYQQITFSESMDSIFVCLMIGYFSSNNYEKCVETYKRYVKLSKSRVVNIENNLEINTYYYVAQWLLSNRNQYLTKIKENFDQAEEYPVAPVVQRTILELIDYFKIPVKLT